MNANVTSNEGVGGILGYKHHDTDDRQKLGTPYVYVENCYNTGKINTFNRAGGILGYGKYGNTYIRKCYSMVNITSKITSGNSYIGGIAGYSDAGASSITNNFYLGNIYVAGNGVGCTNRIYGNNTGTASYKNYAYKDQLINGVIIADTLGATGLLSYQEAFQLKTYSNLLGWENEYAYTIIRDGNDFNLLENEYLPQVNDTEGNVLPNQKLIAIDNDLKLESITSTPSVDKTNVTVVMKFENRNNLNLTKVKIENNDMEVVDGSWQTTKDSRGLTVVTFVATPNRAYDSYKIESIYYERNGEEVEKEIITKIKVELYKGISNATEWNEFFAGEGRTSEGQNVKITGNIDFSTVNKIESNVVIGKLEADSTKTISNVNISNIGSYSGFIKEVKTSLKNITFENCQIKGQASYSGIISVSRAATSNCKFNNITIDCSGDYIGIVSRNIAGSMNNVTLNNVTVNGKNYVGSLVGQSTSTGNSTNIEGTYLKVTGEKDYIGGIYGYSDGRLTNISAYQYSTNGKKDSDNETTYLVKGNQYVGGTLGQYGGSGNYATTLKTTNSKIQGTNYISGNIGYGSGNATDLTSENNTITGTGNYIGGNVGYNGWTFSDIKSINNNISGGNNVGGNCGGSGYSNDTKLVSENNKISGKNNVGGNVGIGDSYYSYMYNSVSRGANQEIQGANHIGGAIGRSIGRVKSAKTENCTITATENYVGGVIGSSEYSTTSISATNSDNYAVSGANAKNVTVTGNMNYVGGIVGSVVGTLAGCVLENSTVTAKGNNAGGITGFYTGYTGKSASSISSTNFFLWHSYATNSTITGLNNVGGITGNFIYGNIQYCYVANTSVIAKSNGAGGIVGYFDNTKLSNIQYKASIKYNFIANVQDEKVIAADNSVGGLIGIAAKKLNYDEDIEKYNNVECNLITTDIKANGRYISMGIGSVARSDMGLLQSPYMNNIYVYNCSRLNGVQVGGIEEEKTSYSMISAEELSTNIYTKNEKIMEKYEEEDEDGNITEYEKQVGNKGLNFGTARYDYNNGYFPLLKTNYSANLYWGSSELNIVQNKVPIPNRAVEFSEDAISLDDIDISTMSLDVLEDEELPDVTIYASDIDKINIEFRNLEGNDAKFKITSKDEVIIEPSNIDEQIYTLKYDFETPLELEVYNLSYSYKKEILPEDVRNILSIVDDEYLYLNEHKISSNKRTLDGEYSNLYKDKLLDKNGNIYDIKTMEKLSSNENKIKLLDEKTPIFESKLNNINVETFAHSSKVTNDSGESVYKPQQIFVKNGEMYVVDGKLDNKNGSVIIDSYNNKQYETILGEDGVMYDLLTEIKYPSGFKNKNIKSITSNADTNSNIALVYYENGKVIGFNYITGEEVYNNNVKDEDVNIVNYIMDNFSVANISYNINKADYVAATELASKLDKVSVDEATEKLNKDNIEIKVDMTNETEQNTVDTQNNTVENTTNVTSSSFNTTSSKENNQNVANNKYVTAYDAGTKSYVVYSTAELIKTDAPNTQTENEKINANKDLISYYTNLSNGLSKFKNVGIIIIALTLLTICIILIILYKKTNR